MTQPAFTSFNKPEIYITDEDFKLLSPFANGASAAAELLFEEIDRAERVEPNSTVSFVKIGSTIQYKDMTSGTTKQVQLVLPKDADISNGQISILTPVGASLIGLTENAGFEWVGNDGHLRELKILSISNELK
ncbi:GreA/GreB family elongation factor [Algimonas arctica]|nr:GreA/GreB family elongation factor [Algimonas arctica]